ncbi:MAG: OmpA family protein [Bacteroidota bacterium]
MKYLYIPIIAFLGICINVNAQEKSRKEAKGDKYAFCYSYEKAIKYYSHSKVLSVEGQRQLAESYRKSNMNTEAETAYATLISMQSNVLPEDYYNYSMVLKGNGKYYESRKEMDKFQELKPFDLRAKDFGENKQKLTSYLVPNDNYKIHQLGMNSEAQDFGASYYKNQVVFASTRTTSKMIKRDYNANGMPFLDMYVSNVDSGQLSKPKTFENRFDLIMHDGPASFSNNSSFMAYTRNNCDLKGKDKIVNLQIFFSTYKEGKWSKPVPFYLNNNDYSVGQPSLSADGNIMYFTSNMSGGYGGADIYRTVKTEKGEWGVPENMGNTINTESDEMFPFYSNAEGSQKLFFASNGRYGLGGLDIFICEINESSIGRVYNAGTPINSRYDDFAVIIDSKTNKGYFSSDRVGGSGNDDIYAFDFIQAIYTGKKIKGIAKNNLGKPIPNTFITFFDDKGKILDTLTTKDDASYAFLVDSNKLFKITGTRENYLEGISLASSFGRDTVIIADVTLLTKEELIANKMQVIADLGVILELKSVYFDLDKFNIRPDAEVEFNKIVKIMNEYPDMIVELGSYTDCRETIEYNQILSNKRAFASASYIKKRITNPSRITGKGFSESKLTNGCACEGDVVSECTEDDHQKNRRTEFIIIKNLTPTYTAK